MQYLPEDFDAKKHLHFVYWLMLATEDLLAEAAKYATGELKAYFEKHRDEECEPRDHPAWMREDLTRIGVDFSLDYTAAAIAGSQYYLIRNVHPAHLLGYSYVLESSPKPAHWVDQLEAKHGPLPCLRYHSIHDPGHVKDILAQIEKLPEQLQKDVMQTAQQVTLWLMSRG